MNFEELRDRGHACFPLVSVPFLLLVCLSQNQGACYIHIYVDIVVQIVQAAWNFNAASWQGDMAMYRQL